MLLIYICAWTWLQSEWKNIFSSQYLTPTMFIRMKMAELLTNNRGWCLIGLILNDYKNLNPLEKFRQTQHYTDIYLNRQCKKMLFKRCNKSFSVAPIILTLNPDYDQLFDCSLSTFDDVFCRLCCSYHVLIVNLVKVFSNYGYVDQTSYSCYLWFLLLNEWL